MKYDVVLKYCKEEGITVKDFERLCDLSNGTVGKWKDGKYEPSMKNLSKIIHNTGLSATYWIGGLV